MVIPILTCQNPYKTAQKFADAGWNVDFSNPPESGDPLVGVSLCGNVLLLGITEGYVPAEMLGCIGCGVELYLAVPDDRIHEIYRAHRELKPTQLAVQPWGALAYEVNIDGFRLMIASQSQFNRREL